MIDCNKLVILPHAKSDDIIANATDNKQKGIICLNHYKKLKPIQFE